MRRLVVLWVVGAAPGSVERSISSSTQAAVLRDLLVAIPAIVLLALLRADVPPGLLLVLLLVFALVDHGIRHSVRLDACERPGPGTNDLGAHRRAARISQEELGQDMGVSLRTIVAIENGRHEPGVALALSLAHRVGVRVEDLFPVRVLSYCPQHPRLGADAEGPGSRGDAGPFRRDAETD